MEAVPLHELIVSYLASQERSGQIERALSILQKKAKGEWKRANELYENIFMKKEKIIVPVMIGAIAVICNARGKKNDDPESFIASMISMFEACCLMLDKAGFELAKKNKPSNIDSMIKELSKTDEGVV